MNTSSDNLFGDTSLFLVFIMFFCLLFVSFIGIADTVSSVFV